MIKFLRILVVALLLAPGAALAQFTDQRTWAPVSTGTANAQLLAIDNVVGPPVGVVFRFTPVASNTGPATLNINGTGAKNITKPSAAGTLFLTGGELQVGQVVEALFDGTNYQLVSNLNAAAAQTIISPQGYLTPCPQATGATLPTGCTANSLLPTGDVSVGSGLPVTGLVYTPVNGGNQVPIWNGTQFVNFQFQEITLTIPSSRLANTLYDVCVFNNSGTPGIGISPAWTNSTVGSSARGTGASTPQIQLINGIWVNSVTMSVVNGGTTTVVPANQCTTVATVLINSTPGQLAFNRTTGQNRMWSVTNIYNTQNITLVVADPTASWAFSATNGTIRASNNNTANNARVVQAVQVSPITALFNQSANYTSSAGVQVNGICIGWDVSNACAGAIGMVNQSPLPGPVLSTASSVLTATFVAPSALGLHQMFSLEDTVTSAGGSTAFGGLQMYFSVTFR